MAVEVNPNPSIGVGIWLIFSAYLLVLLALLIRSLLTQFTLPLFASVSHRAQRAFSSQTLLDYFTNDEFIGPVTLACGILSSVVLAAIITSTPTDVYVNGFAAFAWLPAGLFGVFGYLLLAARLSKLSAIRKYSSPIDFLNDRFRSSTMRAITGSVMVLSAIVFMAILMKAAGSLIEVVSVGSISALSGAIGVGAVILCFEFMGGLASVGLVDIIQCVIITFSFFIMYILQSTLFGGFAQVLKTIANNNPTVADAPSADRHIGWILWTVPFIAFPLYPHVMPRLQRYQSTKALKFALVALSLMPFFVVPAMIAFGISGRSLYPDLPAVTSTLKQTSADIFALTIRVVLTQGSGYYFIASVIFTGCMSVIMSTASSSISGVSSVIALDLYRPLVGAGSSVHVGRIISAVSAMFLLSFAAVLSGVRLMSTSSCIGLLNGVMLQLMPSFVLGLYTHFDQALLLNIGMICGISTSVVCHLVFVLTNSTVPADLGSFLGLIFNAAIVYIASLFMPAESEAEKSNSSASVSDVFSLRLSREATVESPMNHKTKFGKFRTAMPSGLVGWRMNPNLDLTLDFNELSANELSKFSSDTFAIDHARIGTTTLGSIGRAGDGNTEPIHNPVLLGTSAFFLVLSSPFYFSSTNAGISTIGIPFWIYLSFLSAAMSSVTLIYVMFSSWDVKDLQSRSLSENQPSIEALSTPSRMNNSIQETAAPTEPSITRESFPFSKPAITRYTSNGDRPFAKQSRVFHHDPKMQQPQPPPSSEFRSGKSDFRSGHSDFRSGKAEKGARFKDRFSGKSYTNPGRKNDRNNVALPNMDFGSDLGSFSLEEEIRHNRYG